MMTAKELRMKNALLAKRRAEEAAMKAASEEKVSAAAELAAEEIEADPIPVEFAEGEKETEAPKTAKKRGRKPANRVYMVDEDVEEANAEE